MLCPDEEKSYCFPERASKDIGALEDAKPLSYRPLLVDSRGLDGLCNKESHNFERK